MFRKHITNVKKNDEKNKMKVTLVNRIKTRRLWFGYINSEK